jgi:hypothetical protein
MKNSTSNFDHTEEEYYAEGEEDEYYDEEEDDQQILNINQLHI